MKGLRNVKPQTFNPKPRYPDMGRIIYLDIWFVKPLNTAPKMQKKVTKRYNYITKSYNTKPKYLKIWEKVLSLRNVFIRDNVLFKFPPLHGGPAFSGGYLTRIVMSSILIYRQKETFTSFLEIGSGYLSGLVLFFMVWET